VNVHRLDEERHRAFLAEQRRDPITGRLFAPGDSIVLCAGCGSAFLVDSWTFLGGRHDNQTATLARIPSTTLNLNRKRTAPKLTITSSTPASPPVRATPPSPAPPSPEGCSWLLALAGLVTLLLALG
jgi:hypothetical protein